MKKVTAVFCLMLISLTIQAEELAAQAQVLNGRILLKNESGKSVELLSGPVQLSLEKPNLLTGWSRWYKGELRLNVTSGENIFLFTIPEKQIKNESDYSVHQDWTEQGYNLVSTQMKSTVSKRVFEGRVSCQDVLIVPVAVDVTDSGGQVVSTTYENKPLLYPGKQTAIIQEESWTEYQRVQIYNADGSIEIKTKPQLKTKQTTLEKKDDCKSL